STLVRPDRKKIAAMATRAASASRSCGTTRVSASAAAFQRASRLARALRCSFGMAWVRRRLLLFIGIFRSSDGWLRTDEGAGAQQDAEGGGQVHVGVGQQRLVGRGGQPGALGRGA